MSKEPLRPVEEVVADFIEQCEREALREALREIFRQRAARRRRAAMFGLYGSRGIPRRPYSGREAL